MRFFASSGMIQQNYALAEMLTRFSNDDFFRADSVRYSPGGKSLIASHLRDRSEDRYLGTGSAP